MMSIRPNLGRWIPAAWVIFGTVLATAQPAIQWVGSGSASKDFSVTNLASTNFSVEASQDLSAWFQVGSGPSPQGAGSLQSTNLPGVPFLFFRGREGVGSPAKVAPQIDTNTAAVVLLTPETGGSCSLTNAEGVIFSFQAQPGDVAQAVAVRMNVVTNFSAFPAANPMREAVAFEPEGYQFFGAPSLKILFPTNIPAGDISSFSFAGDGGRFHLVPDRAFTNQVRVPITHFSGVGTATWTPEQRVDLARQVMEAFEDAANYSIARDLAKARENAGTGGENNPLDPKLAAQLVQSLDEYYHNAIEPFIAEARTNCALAKLVLPRLVSHVRQRQILGVDDGNQWPEAVGLFEDAQCACAKEALEKCKSSQTDIYTLTTTLLSIERQGALLGVGSTLDPCGLGNVWAVLGNLTTLPCAPHWVGTLSYSDRTDNSTNFTAGTTEYTKELHAQLSFDAQSTLAEVVDQNPATGEITWRITFVAQAAGTVDSYSKNTTAVTCGSWIKDDWKKGSGSGAMTLHANVSFTGNQVTGLSLTYDNQQKLDYTWTTRDSFPSCTPGGKPIVINDQGTMTDFLGPILPDFSQMTFTTNSLAAIEATGLRDQADGGIDGAHVVAQIKLRLVAKAGN